MEKYSWLPLIFFSDIMRKDCGEEYQMQKFLFSVVVPIYNVENYLEETIKSVIQQTIGFQNIQLILVNDGSPDNSEAICLKYKEKYPENVIYIKQENGGVSKARNTGLEVATGDYVNFLDSDDIWEKDVFAKAHKLFSSNPSVDIIGVRQQYFEALTSYPSLDYKFKNKKDGVYDVVEHFNYIQLSVTSAFIRTEVAKMTKFDTRIKYSEDAKYLFELFILTKNTKLGLIGSSKHLYRRRFAETSAIQVKDYKTDWYQETVDLSYRYITDKCKKEFPEIRKFIYYYIMYEYQWRIYFPLKQVTSLTEEERREYVEKSLELIKQADDDIILMQLLMPAIYKHQCLSFKYPNERDAFEKIIEESKNLCDFYIHIRSLNIEDNLLKLTGTLDFLYSPNLQLYCQIGNVEKEIPLKENLASHFNNLLDSEFHNPCFTFELPLEGKEKLSFFIKYGNKTLDLSLTFELFSFLGNARYAHRKIGKWHISHTKKELIFAHHGSFGKELLLQASLLRRGKWKNMLYRFLGSISRKLKFHKEIWILSDGKRYASSNGEALMRYLSTVTDKKVKYYFVVNPGCKEKAFLQRFGKVFTFHSFRYHLLFLKADKFISSKADLGLYNPFGSMGNYMRDLYPKHFVYMPDYMTTPDELQKLNSLDFCYSLIMVGKAPHWQDLSSLSKYCYSKDIVKKTGYAIEDYQENQKANKSILVAPVMRDYFAPKSLTKKEERAYNSHFKDLSFYHFYQQLLKDEKLKAWLLEHHYTIRFLLPYGLEQQRKDFEVQEGFEIVCGGNILEEIKRNDILVTDYTFLGEAFASFQKPVILNRFDEQEFQNHYETVPYPIPKEWKKNVVHSYEELQERIRKCGEEEEEKTSNPMAESSHQPEICKNIYEEILKLK